MVIGITVICCRAAMADFWQARLPQWQPHHWCAAAFYSAKNMPALSTHHLRLTCSPDGGQVVPSGKVVFSQAKVPVRDPMASTEPMLNILTVYLTLHKARLT